ncbi:MAG: hypothetical protein OEP45_11100 [Acidobacteriota bacterium]|nr:hypothetical protein [Acidobacteriota bacterium]
MRLLARLREPLEREEALPESPRLGGDDPPRAWGGGGEERRGGLAVEGLGAGAGAEALGGAALGAGGGLLP